METVLSTKGQIVVPKALRERLGLRPGDRLEANEEDGRLILTPRRNRRGRPRIVTDPITGLPALTFGPGAPKLTSEQVAAMLADFP
jgi:AbrB family looped-hinge helix DNA binding protein